MIEQETSNSHRRVVITGIGQISAAGLTPQSLWETCKGGKSKVRAVVPTGDFFPENALRFAAPAEGFTGSIADFGELDPALSKNIRKSLKLMAREIQMGVASAQRALRSASVGAETFEPSRVGVSFASDYVITTPEELCAAVAACLDGDQFDFSRWGVDGLRQMTPVWQLKFLPNMSTSHISILNSFHGVGFNTTGREASVGASLAEAVLAIRSGRVDAMVVGATGSRIHPVKQAGAIRGDVLADPSLDPETASRPFDNDRTGMVLGEGAAAVFIETLEGAQKRGVPIFAEVLGSVTRACPRYRAGSRDLSSPSEDDLTRSYLLTLGALFARAEIAPDKIGHINANGLGTPLDDRAEAAAIRTFFGSAADTIPVTCLKGHIGNPGAGGGFIDLIASILALKEGALFPILNNRTDDPRCPIRPVRQFGEPAGKTFLKLAGQKFGQTSAVLIRGL
ncbi:MAG: beta-ketoacyl-[Thermoguttaceae bacterium]|nr:beta-ketoacyl-[acyl-carrier-protein] synthase family protein [Thermoguttaceae bacterium]MBQ6619206.1 beta-ketoacyl-[acyl-carrier-protein] synthase family protein [Thermoguttaceae bacterium]MBR2584515.1 beta-ketoacyl-[acyl-carrier-protein] synthase family protein [Thermoguttaceae bacterium]